MTHTSHVPASIAIGKTLKSWRDQKRLSLREVEEASYSLPEAVSFEYVSKLERGLVMPSVPKLATLAAVYGRPVYDIIDLYETVRMRALAPARGTYESFRRLGRENLENGKLNIAIGCFLGALEVAEGAPKRNPDRLAAAYAEVGHALVQAGRHVSARNYFEDALRSATDPEVSGRLLGDIAVANQHAGNGVIAEILANQGLAYAGKHESSRPAAQAVLARILLEQGRYKEAEPLLRQAIKGWEDNSQTAEAIEETANLGLCLVQLGKTAKGLALLAEAADKAGLQKQPGLRAATLLTFGKGLVKAGRDTEAAGPLLAALRIARDHDLREEGFRSSYYLWRIASNDGARADESEYLEIARKFRALVLGYGEEAAHFDLTAPHIRRRRRRRRKSA